MQSISFYILYNNPYQRNHPWRWGANEMWKTESGGSGWVRKHFALWCQRCKIRNPYFTNETCIRCDWTVAEFFVSCVILHSWIIAGTCTWSWWNQQKSSYSWTCHHSSCWTFGTHTLQVIRVDHNCLAFKIVWKYNRFFWSHCQLSVLVYPTKW